MCSGGIDNLRLIRELVKLNDNYGAIGPVRLDILKNRLKLNGYSEPTAIIIKW